MNLRQLEFFVALARETHFGRAAEACAVTQPALSMAIRRLEAELGVRLVERGAAGTVGLTDAGAALVERARAVVVGAGDLGAEAGRLRGRLTATLRIGVVPTAVVAVPAVTAGLLHAHPGVRVRVRTDAAPVLVAALLRRELDVALIHDEQPHRGLLVRPLYRERLMFVDARDPQGRAAAPGTAVDGDAGRDGPGAAPGREAPPGGDPGPGGRPGPGPITWREVAEHELCLLSAPTQYRAIVDRTLASVGATARPRIEADSFATLVGYVRQGWPTVLGHPWSAAERLPPWTRVRPIVAPVVDATIALVHPDVRPGSPVTRALLESLPDGEVVPAPAPAAG